MSIKTPAYNIRTYRNGDENDLASLFNKVNNCYAGLVPRTPAFWLWCCRMRPGVIDKGIYVVKAGEKTIAYAVVTNIGEILEFCYDPKDAGEEVVYDLLNTIESYIMKLGVSSLFLNAPMNDQIVHKVCRDLGYAESSPPYALQLSIVNLQGLVREILESKLKNGEVSLSKEILLKVRNPSGVEHLIISSSNIIFQNDEKNLKKPDLEVETDRQTIISCIFRQLNLKKAFLARKIKVSPFWKVTEALSLLSSLRLNDSLYIPLSDYG